MSQLIFEMDNIAFSYGDNTDFNAFINHLDISVGEKNLLIGESGSGKTTLLSLIAGFLVGKKDQSQKGTPSSKMEFLGVDWLSMAQSKKDRFRADHMGIIFQQFNLLPYATVLDNILLPLQFSKLKRENVPSPKEEVLALCNSLGLDQKLLHQKAFNLSVGQQQRVAIARALIGRPALILADEPTSSLDHQRRDDFMRLLLDQIDANKTALLMVSHDLTLSPYFTKAIEIDEILQKVDN